MAAPETVRVTSQGRNGAVDTAVQHIQRLIDLRRVLPGDSLSPAAEIAKEVGVNRVAVLQALNLLEREGLVRVRPGPGGARVIGRDERPPDQRLARAMARRETLEHVVVLREILDSGIAHRVADRGMPPRFLKRAKKLIEHMEETGNRDEYLALDTEFHELVAESTGSELLGALTLGLRQIFLIGLDAVDLPPERLAGSNHEHRRLLSSIERRAAAEASDWSMRHAEESTRLIAKTLGLNLKGARNSKVSMSNRSESPRKKGNRRSR